MKKIVFILLIFPATLFSQVAGITYTPGRLGSGVVIGTENILVGYEFGKYVVEISGLRDELRIDKFSTHVAVFKSETAINYIGVGYNVFRGDCGFIRKDKLSPISIEAGGSVGFGRVNALLLFDFVNWEGKVGLTINIKT